MDEVIPRVLDPGSNLQDPILTFKKPGSGFRFEPEEKTGSDQNFFFILIHNYIIKNSIWIFGSGYGLSFLFDSGYI